MKILNISISYHDVKTNIYIYIYIYFKLQSLALLYQLDPLEDIYFKGDPYLKEDK